MSSGTADLSLQIPFWRIWSGGDLSQTVEISRKIKQKYKFLMILYFYVSLALSS
jgi:hypothetical protein